MSVQIKSLSNSAPTKDISLAAPLDTFNIIPTANEVYTLYSAPNDSINSNKKAAIVKSIRLVNILAQTVNISLYLNRPTASGQNRRRLLAPKNLPIPQSGAYIDDAEITLEPGDKIQAETPHAMAIHYVISGVERDAT
jgi:hypothetical protein